MKILQVHNYYQFPGGEDEVLNREKMLLEKNGHYVVQYVKQNREILNFKGIQKLKFYLYLFFNPEVFRDVVRIIRKEKIEVVHIHNIFPLVTVAVIFASFVCKVPIVYSLHNPRLLCPSANFMRNREVCQLCMNKLIQYPALMYKCYRGSSLYTLPIVINNLIYNKLKIYKLVNGHIVFTDLYYKFFQTSCKNISLVKKPHFVFDMETGFSSHQGPNYFLFVGRLDEAKGVSVLLAAFQKIRSVDLLLRGEGPLEEDVRSFINATRSDNIRLVGRLKEKELNELYSNSLCLVWPSIGFYETFGLVAIEAYCFGKAVVASNIGVMAEIVKDKKTGLLFEPGNSDDLAEKIMWAYEHPKGMKQMGKKARKEFEEKYTAERNYKLLTSIYEEAVEARKMRG